MKSKSIPAVIVCLALASLAFASTASATTLEVKGVKQTGAVALTASQKPGSSSFMTATGQFFLQTCTASTIEGKSSTFTGTTVSVPLSVLSFGSCLEGPIVVDAPGTLSIEARSGTTNATVRMIGTKITTPSAFGTLTCLSSNSAGTDIGTLTGVASGTATIEVQAVLDCGVVTAQWLSTYVVTGPEGLGVTS